MRAASCASIHLVFVAIYKPPFYSTEEYPSVKQLYVVNIHLSRAVRISVNFQKLLKIGSKTLDKYLSVGYTIISERAMSPPKMKGNSKMAAIKTLDAILTENKVSFEQVLKVTL